MAGTETIILMIADAPRRASCFAALADRPQRIVRGFSDAGDAAAALDSCDAGCLVIDPAGLARAALDNLLRAAAAHPALVTVLLADRLDGAEALALVQAHPADILPAAVDAAALAARIALLLPLAQARRVQWQGRNSAARALARLSPRERDVLAELAEGRTSKDIARAMGVSPRTIEVHRASIMRRTGTETLAELLRLYFLIALAPAPTIALAA
jgi:DNA-binding NarL/FixJ family response regulator